VYSSKQLLDAHDKAAHDALTTPDSRLTWGKVAAKLQEGVAEKTGSNPINLAANWKALVKRGFIKEEDGGLPVLKVTVNKKRKAEDEPGAPGGE
jgi:hypothetical protein